MNSKITGSYNKRRGLVGSVLKRVSWRSFLLSFYQPNYGPELCPGTCSSTGIPSIAAVTGGISSWSMTITQISEGYL